MKLRILALLLALLSVFSVLTLSGCADEATDKEAASTAGAETDTQKDPSKPGTPSEYFGTDWINAAEFGLVGDGKTLNDRRMREYIKYHAQTPLYFPEGVYCFAESLDFPDHMYIELDPHAELKCVAEQPLDYFITVRKDVQNWCQLDGYTKSYIKGGTINANYCAKVGLAVCQCYHAQFEGFTLKNVLEKGIVTWYNTKELRDGAFIGRDLVIFNDKAIKGTVGIYDAHFDTNVYGTSIVNFETAIYTYGGRFYECTAWVNSAWTSAKGDVYENLTFAVVDHNGGQALFDNCTVDTMRYGYKLKASSGAGCTITNTIWTTNENFYSKLLQKQYPRTVFYCEEPKGAYFYVVGAWIPEEEYLSFTNGEMFNSMFINIRAVEDSKIPYLRNDSEALRDLTFFGSEKPETTSLNGATDFDKIKIPYTYDCELRVGSGGKNAPPVKEAGVLEVTTVGSKIVQKFYGTKTSLYRVFDGARWGAWIQNP